MPPGSTLATAPSCVRLVAQGEVRQLAIWREAFQDLAKDHRYSEIVADTLGFDCRALIVEDEAGGVRALQPCFFVEQDLVLAAHPAIRSFAAGVRRFAPGFLRPKMLMVGCAAGEGYGLAAAEMSGLLHEGALASARAAGARLVVWKDIPATHRATLRALRNPPAHCVHLASMPATKLLLDFRSFDEYLARRLSRATRKNLRRKFKALADAPPLVLTVTNDLGEAVEQALALYEQVFRRSKLQFEHLNQDFLEQLAARMPERVRFFLWRQEGRLVAFSLCLIHGGVLYDEYLGLDYRVALDLHLYFVTFRDIVTWALAHGLTAYHSTPLNYEPKLRLGFELRPLDLYVTLTSPTLRRLARPFLRHSSPTAAEPILAQFANARAMNPDA